MFLRWPSVDDGNYYFVVCARRKERCKPTQRFGLYDVPDQLIGQASGSTVHEFTRDGYAGDPMQQTVTGNWSITYTLKRDVFGTTDDYAMVSSSATETTSGHRTTQIGEQSERCEWLSDEATFTDTAEGALNINRDSAAPLYDFGFGDYESNIEYTENCTSSGGANYEQYGYQDSVIACCAAGSEGEPFNGFPLAGSYDHVQDGTTFYGDVTKTTTHVEWQLKEAD